MKDDFKKFMEEQIAEEERMIDALIKSNERIRNTKASPEIWERLLKKLKEVEKTMCK